MAKVLLLHNVPDDQIKPSSTFLQACFYASVKVVFLVYQEPKTASSDELT